MNRREFILRAGVAAAHSKTDWKSVFSRVKDDIDGNPRFYIRGTRNELFGYDGYMDSHKRLNEILEFLGGNNKAGWTGSDSPMNVAEYEYVDYFDPDDEGIDDHIEIYAGNYMFCDKSQGAWIVGFKLFRALLGHLDLSQPRRLKGEKYGAVQVRRSKLPGIRFSIPPLRHRASSRVGGDSTARRRRYWGGWFGARLRE